jgi:septal ring factor EnvC (AmiA/AmiB activator)
MSDELSRLQQRVDQHEREIEQISLSTREMIDGQKQVSKSLQDLTMSLNQYVVKHDFVSRQNDELTKDVRTLREQAAANQPVIDGLKTLNGKLIWLVISAFVTTGSVIGFIVTKGAQ